MRWDAARGRYEADKDVQNDRYEEFFFRVMDLDTLGMVSHPGSCEDTNCDCQYPLTIHALKRRNSRRGVESRLFSRTPREPHTRPGWETSRAVSII